jgi:hypothetical protein
VIAVGSLAEAVGFYAERLDIPAATSARSTASIGPDLPVREQRQSNSERALLNRSG